MCAKTLSMSALACLVALSGCGTSDTDEIATTPAPSREMKPDCGADQLGGYLGQPASDSVIAAIRQWRGDKPVRVLRPGMAVTMDYRPERLNVQVDGDGKIKGFSCS